MQTPSADHQVSLAVLPLQPSDSGDRSMFVVNKPKLSKHTKSRKGCLACKARRVEVSLIRRIFNAEPMVLTTHAKYASSTLRHR
jgi:hypothetical protein